MNFRNEREHDDRLIELIQNLDQKERLDLLETSLGIPTLGGLIKAQRRRAFDLEFQFQRRRLLIETKVDSDEGGRWGAFDDDAAWQTNQKLAAEARDGDICLFITYGFAEFFTKWLDFGAAAGTARVRHVKLDEIIDLVQKAAPILRSPLLNDWLAVLQSEQRKRREIPAVLSAFSKFRRTYLKISGDVDFTPTRVGFNAPELAFPAFAHLLEEWRGSSYSQRYGRLSLYPVGRLVLPVDSILNWFELWRDFDPLTVGGILRAERRLLYFEVNEDFNLHLKLGSDASESLVDRVRKETARRLGSMTVPDTLVASRPEFHKQEAYAVWEWDLDLPALIYESGKATEALGTLFDSVIPELA